jgi:hypothetical protein
MNRRLKREKLVIECHNCGRRLAIKVGERFTHACIGWCDTPGSLQVTLHEQSQEPRQ